MNFFTKVILACVAVLIAAAGIVLFFRGREAARVEALIREAAAWAAAGDAERVADLIDDDFAGDATATRSEIRRRIRPGAFQRMEIRDLEVGVDGDEARVRVVVLVEAREVQYPIPQAFELTLRKREAGWRVIDAQQTDLLRRR